jgi:hypothetical protein
VLAVLGAFKGNAKLARADPSSSIRVVIGQESNGNAVSVERGK